VTARRTHRSLAISLLLAAALDGPLPAQDQSDSTAYQALTGTPLVAFAPVVGIAVTAEGAKGLAFHGRYSIISFRSEDVIHSVGIGAEVPLAAGRLAVTAGYYAPSCSADDCPGHPMASLEFQQNLASVAMGRSAHSASLNLGVQVGAGIAAPGDSSLISGLASIPVALVPHGPSTRIFPFVAPGIGLGIVTQDSGTEAGMLPTLAGGIGLLALDDRLGLLAGVNRAFMRGGNWLAGISLSWHPVR
jgi:hypothetical protein